MKNKLKKSLKATILFIFILLLMTNCEQNSLIEANQNSLISNQQSRFKVTVLNNEKIKSNNKIVQKLISIDLKNKKKSNSTFSKEIYNKLGFTINTDNVNYMEDTQTGIHSYSFQIFRDSIKTPNLENLLIQSNSKGGYDAYIIQYGFTSEEYANLNANSIKNYKTSIYSIDFDTSTFKNGMFSKMAYGCTETWEWAMIDDGDRGELVGAGNEEPFEEGWVLTGISCGYSDDGTGNSGGQTTNPTNTSGGGGTSAVIAAPNTVPYTSQLKNFESGTLNSVERTYYNRDSNIKNTIDQYLINQNFSNNSKLEAKSYLQFASSLNFNFEQFNWVFTNRNGEDVNTIKAYLSDEFITPEVEGFVKEAIEAMDNDGKNDGEVDFNYRVIEDKSFKNNPCLKGVYDKLGGAVTFQNYLKKFDSNFSVANLKLSVGVHPAYQSANAVTIAPRNYMINIMFNPNNLSRPQLDIARTFIHELLHAEIYRKLLSCANLPNININNYTNAQWQVYINNLKNDFPGLFDYYMRYQYNVPKGQLISDAQHQVMAQHYRQIIVEVLKQFDNNVHADQIYNSLAWIGLMGEGEVDMTTGLPLIPSVAWGKLPQDQRLQILSTYNNFVKTNVSCQ